jgi:GNAT superfamily N-acetyltransferase
MGDLRQLHPGEWGRLKDVFVSEFGTDAMPDPESTLVFAEFDGDSLVCFFMLERVTHAGPFYVAPEYRNRGLALAMAWQAERMTAGQELYIAATRKGVEKMCADFGLTRVRGTLWRKEKANVW